MEQNNEKTWQTIQKQITDFLIDYLLKVEWFYGDCRAPFRFPPQFKTSGKQGEKQYSCFISPDYPGSEPLVVTSSDPANLPGKVKAIIISHYGDMDKNVPYE